MHLFFRAYRFVVRICNSEIFSVCSSVSLKRYGCALGV